MTLASTTTESTALDASKDDVALREKRALAHLVHTSATPKTLAQAAWLLGCLRAD